MKRDPVYDKMRGKKPIVKVACRLRFLPRRVLKSVFEAALPSQKHLEASFASPHADQNGLQPVAISMSPQLRNEFRN